ncbi:MAG: hypothetical protein M1820_008555 [Bogoriella megaspora]|nr:MAG: hypothetical protein M1820_008555 [Bogoriella megaspora]
MAPATTPRGKKRENNYFNVGKQGRKTGITLKDTGIRDADGLEPIDGIFSSPEKSPPKRNGGGTQKVPSVEPKKAAQSSKPETTDYLSAKKINGNGNTRLPPPGRSPIKTSLGSSPRRLPSIGPPSRLRASTDHLTPEPSIAMQLDYNENEITPSIEHSPTRAIVSRKRGSTSAMKDAHTTPPTNEPTTNGLESSPIHQQDSESHHNFGLDDSLPRINADDSMQMVQDEIPIDPALVEQSTVLDEIPAKKNKGKQKLVDAANQEKFQAQLAEDEEVSAPTPTQKPPKKPPKKARKTLDEALEELSPAQNAKKGAREKRGKTVPSIKEETPASLDARETEPPVQLASPEPEPEQFQSELPSPESIASKPPVDSKKRGRSAKGPSKPKAKRQKTAKPPPGKREPNARIRVANTEERDASHREPSPSSSSRAGSTAPTFKRPGPRSLTLLRQGTPTEDDGARMTRSGRTSVKPFRWWLNEGYEYRRGEIASITRAEEIEPPSKKKPPQRRRGTSRLTSIDEEYDPDDWERMSSRGSRDGEDEDDQLEDWEESGSVLTGSVNQWDSVIDAPTREVIEAEIAFASTSIQTRDVPSANFRYAKLISLPFCGYGLVVLPPGGFKKSKNSRRMQMVFFVHSGRATVNVNDEEFSIGQGGLFQVPRGNNYAIRNESNTREAKLFFSQSCEMQAGIEEE